MIIPNVSLHSAMRWVTLLAATILVMTACGGDDSNEDEPASDDAMSEPASDDVMSEPVSEPKSPKSDDTTPELTPENTMPDDTEAKVEPTESERLAMDAWAIVFDSAADFDVKRPHLENAAQLETSDAAYAEAAGALGGIALDPTAVSIDGDIATVTYDVLFGGNPTYRDLSGEIRLIDSVWIVSRDSYCGFLASARTSCQE